MENFILRRQVTINGKIFRSTYLENYYASIDGDIIQVYYDIDNRTIKKIFLLKQETTKAGYKRVQGPNHSGHHFVHRLVYSAWGPDKLSPYLVIDHKNSIPSKNHIDNLHQVTQKENIQNAVKYGNFRNGHYKKIRVHDTLTDTYKNYDSVRDFLIDIGAPEYMIKHNSLSSIRKRSEYNRYEYIEIQDS